ncbi:conserved membrane hypothetical protein [Gammaproteobacteria bacterium]
MRYTGYLGQRIQPPGHKRWVELIWLGVALLGLIGVLYLRVHPATVSLTPSGVTARPVSSSHEPVDPSILWALTEARIGSVADGTRRINQLIGVMGQRVEVAFLPWYLSFARRKLEEIQAYNAFARDWLYSGFGSPPHDSSTPLLAETFNREFTEKVLNPPETRQYLQLVSRDIAIDYGARLNSALLRVQEERGLSVAEWRRYLESLTPLVVWLDGQTLNIPVASLAGPDPIRNRLAGAIASDLTARFDTRPVVSDERGMVAPNGENLFAVGKHVWIYIGSYLLYWVLIILLIRTGFIPMSLFRALVGWMLWEIFAWGSWLAWESLDFEQTRAQWQPIILQHADVYLNHLRARLIDPDPNGPFNVLYQMERGWQG